MLVIVVIIVGNFVEIEYIPLKNVPKLFIIINLSDEFTTHQQIVLGTNGTEYLINGRIAEKSLFSLKERFTSLLLMIIIIIHIIYDITFDISKDNTPSLNIKRHTISITNINTLLRIP